MNIPLINSNSKQDINTSLIAIRNAINELSRMKESASVEDLQRQINIINQQIANFNSEFSAINTHLNTIDTNILNLQPVDTVASGNLHSVTSNAVANMNSLAMPRYTNVDVFVTAESCFVGKVSFFRILEASSNSPYGEGITNDFYYYVNKLENSNWIRLMAFDIRSNNVYVCTKTNGIWGSWTYLNNQTGVIPKNRYLRIFFDKYYLATDLHIQVQGIGDCWVNIYWIGGSNGAVQQIYNDNNFLKTKQLNGNIGSLTYSWGGGFIDIFNPNDEIEAFIISGSVKSFVVSQ